MRRIPHPSGLTITFDPRWHQYTVSGKQSLKSVSKLLDKHFPFDEARVSQLVSKKTGQSPAEVLASWKRQALLGKNVHAFIESQLLAVMEQVREQTAPKKPATVSTKRTKTPAPPPSEERAGGGAANAMAMAAFLESLTEAHGEEQLYLPVAQEAVDRVLSAYEVIAVEKVIASPQLGLAGTIDFVARNRETGGLLIGDWKTSGSVASNFRFGSFETPATGCLSHLPNGKFYRYALQVITYGHILRLEGYDTELGKELLSRPIEYGIVMLSKNEEGGVLAEYKKVTEQTVMPVDGEATFHDLLHKLLVE